MGRHGSAGEAPARAAWILSASVPVQSHRTVPLSPAFGERVRDDKLSKRGSNLAALLLNSPCHPEPARRRRAEEGPYEAAGAAWKRRGWAPAQAALILFTSVTVQSHRTVPLSPAFGVRVRDDKLEIRRDTEDKSRQTAIATAVIRLHTVICEIPRRSRRRTCILNCQM